MGLITPHVKWWTTSRRETHGELFLDDWEAELFYPEPPYYISGPLAGKVKYLCGYVDIGAGASSESTDCPRCTACVSLLPQAKAEGDRLVAEYWERVNETRRTAKELADPNLPIEQRERAELARLTAKYAERTP